MVDTHAPQPNTALQETVGDVLGPSPNPTPQVANASVGDREFDFTRYLFHSFFCHGHGV